MICSVCIATYKRRQLLRNLLKSIFAQNLPQNINVQIVVVDNDKEKSAEEIIKEFESNDKIWLEYYNQPRKNISVTRNMGVKNSRGEYVLFIDDDETADINWVREHFEAIKTFNADGCDNFPFRAPLPGTKNRTGRRCHRRPGKLSSSTR